MQDNWGEILGDVLNQVDALEKIEQKIAPQLAQIQNNRDQIAPELLSKLDEAMQDIGAKRSELRKLKKELRDVNINNR